MVVGIALPSLFHFPLDSLFYIWGFFCVCLNFFSSISLYAFHRVLPPFSFKLFALNLFIRVGKVLAFLLLSVAFDLALSCPTPFFSLFLFPPYFVGFFMAFDFGSREHIDAVAVIDGRFLPISPRSPPLTFSLLRTDPPISPPKVCDPWTRTPLFRFCSPTFSLHQKKKRAVPFFLFFFQISAPQIISPLELFVRLLFMSLSSILRRLCNVWPSHLPEDLFFRDRCQSQIHWNNTLVLDCTSHRWTSLPLLPYLPCCPHIMWFSEDPFLKPSARYLSILPLSIICLDRPLPRPP